MYKDAYELFRTSYSHNSINIRNPHIYCVNSYFLMFSGSQVQMSYLASKNDILIFYPSILSLYRILERKYTIMAQNPVITITMDNGDVIKAELYPEIAPVSVNNFISLVKKGFYDGLTFHRVIEGFMIQGGCPLGNGTGGPGYTIRGEFSQNGFHNPLKHEAGVLSMARAMHPDSAGSQFFIMHKAAPHLDGAYAAFGKVTDGLDVVNKIAETDTDWNDAPLDPQVIRTITVDTFGVDYPEPEKC